MPASFWMGLMMGVCVGAIGMGAIAVYELFRVQKDADGRLYREQIKHREQRITAIRIGWDIAHAMVLIEPTTVPGLAVLDWTDAKLELDRFIARIEKGVV